MKTEGVAKNMSYPAVGEEVSVAAKNFMNKHGSAGQAIAHGMIKTSQAAEGADVDTEATDDGAEVDDADDAEVEDDTEANDDGFDVETTEVDDEK